MNEINRYKIQRGIKDKYILVKGTTEKASSGIVDNFILNRLSQKEKIEMQKSAEQNIENLKKEIKEEIVNTFQDLFNS